MCGEPQNSVLSELPSNGEAASAWPSAVSQPWAPVCHVSRSYWPWPTVFDRLISDGVVADYADLTRLGRVTQARMTQIMNLLNLAPDIQEEILFLPRTAQGRDVIKESDIRRIATILDWRKQRRLWVTLRDERLPSPTGSK